MRRLYQSMTATRFYITGLRMSRSPKGCQFDPLVRPPQAEEPARLIRSPVHPPACGRMNNVYTDPHNTPKLLLVPV